MANPPSLNVTPQLILAAIILVGAFVLKYLGTIDDTMMKALIAIAIGLVAGTVYTKYDAIKLGVVEKSWKL